MNPLIINFSSRHNGNCANIARYIQSFYPSAQVIHFFNLNVSACGSCDYECFQKREACPYYEDSIIPLYDRICNSSLTYFVVPNYCDYPCSNYFIFNERGCCYFGSQENSVKKYLAVPKKFLVISNTNRDHFSEVFSDQLEEKPQILYLSAKDYGKISLRGDLVTSDQVLAQIREFCL